jgi:hypothetical protein
VFRYTPYTVQYLYRTVQVLGQSACVSHCEVEVANSTPKVHDVGLTCTALFSALTPLDQGSALPALYS